MLKKDVFIEYILCFVSNCFFKVGDKIRKQKEGIVFGFDCNVEINHLVMMYFYNKTIEKLGSTFKSIIVDTFRVVDDFCLISRFSDKRLINEFIKIFSTLSNQNVTIEGCTSESEICYAGVFFNKNGSSKLKIKFQTLNNCMHRFSYDNIRNKFASFINRFAKIAIFNTDEEVIKEQTNITFLILRKKGYSKEDIELIARRVEYSIAEYYHKNMNIPLEISKEDFLIDYSKFNEDFNHKTFTIFSLFGFCNQGFAIKILKSIGIEVPKFHLKDKSLFIKHISTQVPLNCKTIYSNIQKASLLLDNNNEEVSKYAQVKNVKDLSLTELISTKTKKVLRKFYNKKII